MLHQVAKATSQAAQASFWEHAKNAEMESFIFLLQIVMLQAVTIAIWELAKAIWAAVSRAWQFFQKPCPSETVVVPSEAAAKPRTIVFIGETTNSECFHNTASCSGLNFAGKIKELRQCSLCKHKTL